MHSLLFIISGEKSSKSVNDQDLKRCDFLGRIASSCSELDFFEEARTNIVEWFIPYLKNRLDSYIKFDDDGATTGFKLIKGASNYFLGEKIFKIEEMLNNASKLNAKEKATLLDAISDIAHSTRGFYIGTLLEGDVKYWTLDEFLEKEYNEEKTYYINQTFDYHY